MSELEKERINTELMNLRQYVKDETIKAIVSRISGYSYGYISDDMYEIAEEEFNRKEKGEASWAFPC